MTTHVEVGRSWLAIGTMVVLLGGSAVVAAAAVNATPSPPDLEGRELTLARAISLTLQHNPSVQAYGIAEMQASASARQAGRGLNPEVSFEAENFAGSGALRGLSAGEFTLQLSQTFELGGKRSRAQEAAERVTDLVQLAADLNAHEVVAQTTRVFVGALQAQTELALAQELVVLARQDLSFVERRVAQGGASPVEVNRARIAVSMAVLAVERARRSLVAGRGELAARWNNPAPTFGEVVGALDTVGPVPSWDELSGLLAGSPSLQQWDLKVAQQTAEITLAQSLGKVDLQASAGIRHFRDNGENALVAAVAIPLPVRNKNQDGVVAAQFGLQKLAAERQAHYQRLMSELVRYYQELTNAYGQISALRGEILPMAELSMAEMDAAYHKGMFNLTDVLAVRRTWFEVKGAYTVSLASYQETAVAIDLLLGVHRLTSLTSKEKN